MSEKIGNLVITRWEGESIVLEDGTEIYLSRASRGRATIAIKSSQAILRKELVRGDDPFKHAREVLNEKEKTRS